MQMGIVLDFFTKKVAPNFPGMGAEGACFLPGKSGNTPRRCQRSEGFSHLGTVTGIVCKDLVIVVWMAAACLNQT